MRSIGVVLVLALLSGCATITRGTSESFVIETDPPGAAATLTNGMSCTTPCSLKVKRRGDFVVTLEREGYEPVTATVTSSVDGGGAAGMAGNVILGGLIGAGVDAGSGAMHSHKPNPLTVSMVKAGEGSASADVESAADIEQESDTENSAAPTEEDSGSDVNPAEAASSASDPTSPDDEPADAESASALVP